MYLADFHTAWVIFGRISMSPATAASVESGRAGPVGRIDRRGNHTPSFRSASRPVDTDATILPLRRPQEAREAQGAGRASRASIIGNAASAARQLR